MKILIAAAQFSSSLSGIQRHAFNLVRCLLKQPEIAQVHLVLAPWQQELVRSAGLLHTDRVTIHIAEMNRSLWSRNSWYYHRMPEFIAQIKPDVLHLSYPVPTNASAIDCPIVLTLHDLYPYEVPENFGFPKAIFNRLILLQCLRNANAIACVSDATLQRMHQYIPRAVVDKALRIYNCVEADPACAGISPIPEWKGEPFLLSISQHRRNKNIPLIIRTFHRLIHDRSIDPSMKLVVIGIPGPETNRIYRLLSTLRLDGRVVFLHGLPEDSLQWCLKRCEALVAPSETEGFGLPVAEALLAGCRVICSDILAFREIDDGSCHLVPLGKNEEERFAKAILASLSQRPLPPASLPQFSSDSLGRQYMGLYHSLVSAMQRKGATRSKLAKASVSRGANSAHVQRHRVGDQEDCA